MATIRFHLDEHVAFAIAAGLRRLGIDVTTTEDAGLIGATDEDHIAFALAESRVIFTEDEDFLILSSGGVEHAGVAYCHQNTHSIGQVIRALELIHGVYEADEMRGRIEYV